MQNEIQNIKCIFNSLSISGVHYTEFILNCIDRENRYDLLIRIDMDKSALEMYDKSDAHHKWKDTYSNCIDKKAIFDYE